MPEIVQIAHKTNNFLKISPSKFLFRFFKKFWFYALCTKFPAFFDFSKILKISKFFQNSLQEMHASLEECVTQSLPDSASISPDCFVPRSLQQTASAGLGV
jgi:hypothetical protein